METNGGSTINIYFLRHGRSAADDEGVHEGRYDSPLTEAGRGQVRGRAREWQAQNLRFDCVIASTLVRARESAEIVAAALGSRLETDPDWMEVDNRPLAGLSYEEAARRYPQPEFRNPYEPFFGVGESEYEFHCRAIRAVEKVVRRGPGTYLVVAHGGTLSAALRGIAGAQPPVNGRHGVWFAFGDAGYARTTYRPDRHQWLIEELRPGWTPIS